MNWLAAQLGIDPRDLRFAPTPVRWQRCDECRQNSAVINVDTVTTGERWNGVYCLACAPDQVRYLAEWGDHDDITVTAPTSFLTDLAA